MGRRRKSEGRDRARVVGKRTFEGTSELRSDSSVRGMLGIIARFHPGMGTEIFHSKFIYYC